MIFANNDQVENRILHIFVEIFCQLFWKTITFADGNVQKMMTFTESSVLSKHLNIYDLILLYNSFMGCIESGVAFPFCK